MSTCSPTASNIWVLRSCVNTKTRLCRSPKTTNPANHVTGYLNPVTGSKFKTLLDSVSVPRDADDDRTAAERRVQGFDDVLTAILNGGLPADNGVRPHVSVVVD